MIQDARIKPRQRENRRGRDKTVEQRGYPMATRREDRAGDPCEFAPAQRRCYLERIAKDVAMMIEFSSAFWRVSSYPREPRLFIQKRRLHPRFAYERAVSRKSPS